MVWGDMSFRCVGVLKIVNGALNQHGYMDILGEKYWDHYNALDNAGNRTPIESYASQCLCTVSSITELLTSKWLYCSLPLKQEASRPDRSAI